MYLLLNVMEGLVKETIDEVHQSNKDLCSCDRCKLDIAAVALNKLPTSYVVTEKGEVMLRASSLKQQFKVDIIRAITEALETINKRPHHKRKE